MVYVTANRTIDYTGVWTRDSQCWSGDVFLWGGNSSSRPEPESWLSPLSGLNYLQFMQTKLSLFCLYVTPRTPILQLNQPQYTITVGITPLIFKVSPLRFFCLCFILTLHMALCLSCWSLLAVTSAHQVSSPSFLESSRTCWLCSTLLASVQIHTLSSEWQWVLCVMRTLLPLTTGWGNISAQVALCLYVRAHQSVMCLWKCTVIFKPGTKENVLCKVPFWCSGALVLVICTQLPHIVLISIMTIRAP